MTTLQFLGATETVTGSRYLLHIDRQKFLIDCGLFQGTKENRLRNWDEFPVNPSEIDKIFITHAHIDHTGYLPRFCRKGFKGHIHSTHATRDLCEIMLKDSAHLQEEDARWANKKGFSKHKPALPLYNLDDAENVMRFFKPLHYGEDMYLKDNLRIKFKNAGHILGSAFVDFKRENNRDSRKILFSGDFGRPDRPVLADPMQVYNIDYLILDSTYGARTHDDDEPEEKLSNVINESLRRRGVLLVPAFSVGRTQTLLYVLRELKENKKIPDIPIYVDSPMAISATQIFEESIHDTKLTARKLAMRGVDVFKPSNLHICSTVEESKKINEVPEKAIIISASGMATGGRILHHLAARLPYRENTILLIGYQAQGTRGRVIMDGKPSVKIHGAEVPIRAKVEKISGFSGHGDYEEIMAWLSAFNKEPKTLFLVHGEPESMKAFSERINGKFGWKVVIPKYLEKFELDF